ncbi:MAG: hypothetical protein H6Q68_3725 [Firmicutes bacterium]|nr:hypothetical protein [Bacillota bacterium]
MALCDSVEGDAKWLGTETVVVTETRVNVRWHTHPELLALCFAPEGNGTRRTVLS